MTTILIPAVHPFNDKLAIAYYNQGVSPEDALARLRAVGYKINKCKVQGAVIANILRGIYLANTIKPKRKSRAKKSA